MAEPGHVGAGFPGNDPIREIAERDHALTLAEAAVAHDQLSERLHREFEGQYFKPDAGPNLYHRAFDERLGELLNERREPHQGFLMAPWYVLSYWTYRLIAVRSGLSVYLTDPSSRFAMLVRHALAELGVRVSEEECLAEVERFLPEEVSPQSVRFMAASFVSYVQVLHRAALRRRQSVSPGSLFPNTGLAFARRDRDDANEVSKFLESHGVRVIRRWKARAQDPLVVVLSREGLRAGGFWRTLAAWKRRGVKPIVLCAMPKAQLYREPPVERWRHVWEWLGAGVAVQLTPSPHRYVVLLEGLDPVSRKQWWWSDDDAMSIGFAVAIGPRHPAPRRRSRPSAMVPAQVPYPPSIDGTEAILSGCMLASDRAQLPEGLGQDHNYDAKYDELLRLRRKVNGDPFKLPWFVLAHRAWLMFAEEKTGSSPLDRETDDAWGIRYALFALGIGQLRDVPGFLRSFADLPWAFPADQISAVDQTTAAFATLVHHLAQSALVARQRVALKLPVEPCFVSYARVDEDLAKALVMSLEAKGADVWFDVDSLSPGAPLDESLRAGVSDARFLVLLATDAASRSEYVHTELHTAIDRGLKIVPVLQGEGLPEGFTSVRAAAPDAFESPIRVGGPDDGKGFAAVLSRLDRTPEQQARWIQSRPLYSQLRQRLESSRRGGG